MLIGTEVRIVQHRISMKDTYYADLVEVQSLGDHLRTNQDIRTSCPEIHDDTLIGITGTCGIQVHTSHPCLREHLTNLLFYLLRAIAFRPQVGTATTRALCRHTVGKAAIMASQLVQLPMVCQRYVAMLTTRYPTALSALYQGCEATTVLEEDCLFSPF